MLPSREVVVGILGTGVELDQDVESLCWSVLTDKPSRRLGDPIVAGDEDQERDKLKDELEGRGPKVSSAPSDQSTLVNRDH